MSHIVRETIPYKMQLLKITPNTTFFFPNSSGIYFNM